MAEDSNRRYWMRRARALQFRFNFAVWLELYLKSLIAFSVAASVAILSCRRIGIPIEAIAWSFVALTAAGTFISYFAARRTFIGPLQALARLDEAYLFDSRLCSAAGGVGRFPPPLPEESAGLPYNWNLDRLVFLTGIPTVLLVAASLIPMPRTAAGSVVPKQPPLAAAEVERLIDRLEKDAVVERRDLQQLKEQVETITKQNPEQWYDQHSLEAADSLKEKAESGVEGLAHSLEQASKAVGQLSEALKQASPEMKQELKAQLDKAIKQLEEGSLRPSEELSKQLSELANGTPDSIPQELLDSIKGKLKSSAKILKEDLKKGGGGGGDKKQGDNGEAGDQEGDDSECSGGSDNGGMCSEKKKSKQGNGEGEGNAGNNGSAMEGQAGISRGPGTAPLNLKEHSPQLTSPRTEELQSKNGASKDPGDLVGMTSQTPQVDKETAAKHKQAGTAGAAAAGGEAVTSGVYTPDESDVLKKYFH